MTTPVWQAPHNGLPGDLTSTNDPAGINQFLGAHGITAVYGGSQIVTPGAVASTFGSDFYWISPTLIGGIGDLNNNDVAWPFTMPGGSTTIGRVQVAMLPVGTGADIKVSLCADNSGVPNTASPLASTIVPAAEITSLAATQGLANGGPLATQFSNILQGGPYTATSWGTAATSATGLLTSTTTTSYGQYMLMIGGLDSVSGNPVPYTYLVPLSATGAGPAVSGPSLPQSLYTPAVAATADTVISAGGYTGSAYVASVYTANWSSNTGSMSAWAAQASLPAAVQGAQVAVWNDSTAYVIGGYNGTAQSSVYYATMSNQQITSWKTGPQLPTAAYGHIVGVFGNILVAAGGVTSPTSAALGNTYWAHINPDGSLQNWQTGPSMPVPVANLNGNTLVTDSGLFAMGGITTNGSPPTFTQALQSLTVTANGIGAWQVQQYNGSALSLPTGGYANGDGSYTLVSLGLSSTGFTSVQTVYPVPFISVPLPATGLTPGATYHLVFHQVGGSITNYVQLGEVLSSGSKWLYASQFSNASWGTRTGLAILANVFDQTSGGPVVHTWQDPDSSNLAAATTTHLYESHNMLVGACEGVASSRGPLNSNPTFTSGVSPWTATGGTFTQSSAQTHGGFPFSGLLTPNGVAGTASAQSELFPVTAGAWYTAPAYFYSTPGHGMTLAINWFDPGQNLVSTTSFSTTLGAASWTLVYVFGPAPATAAFGQLVVSETGTPPSSALLYVSDLALSLIDPPQTLASVAALDYAPGTVYPPVGVTQLN